MLPDAEDAERFMQWPSAQLIIVLDADTTNPSEGSNLLGLLNKFKLEAFSGHLAWLKGGISSLIREAGINPMAAGLLTSKPVWETSRTNAPGSSSLPRARDLPHSAFLQASTTIAGHKSPKGDEITIGSSFLTRAAALGPCSSRIVAANPFFDNIRQLTELNQGVTERITLGLPASSRARLASVPIKCLREIGDRDEAEEADMLAMQFYKIELAEQRRMLGIMNEHSRDSKDRAAFPFSITAGIEKGSKNR
jgi:protein-tyrosine phosphatase